MAIVLTLYLFLILSCLKIAHNAKDTYSAIVVAGISTVFIFQIFINIGMTLGIMPVTGIPLPFLSYGGSSLVSSMISIGIINNINRQI
jgi:rod shape determining protein RodA